MVETTGVRGPTLARLAMVLALLSIGNTSALRVILWLGETLWIWPWHCLFYILIQLFKSSIYSGQGFQSTFIKVIEQNMVNSIKFFNVVSFFAGPSLASLAIVSVLLAIVR